MSLLQEQAELIGLQAVAWLAGEDELLPVFLGSTGASEQDFREGLGDPAFQGAVLDFLLMNDAWVRQFCAAQDLPPDMHFRARQALPGGGEVHWT